MKEENHKIANLHLTIFLYLGFCCISFLLIFLILKGIGNAMGSIGITLGIATISIPMIKELASKSHKSFYVVLVASSAISMSFGYILFAYLHSRGLAVL